MRSRRSFVLQLPLHCKITPISAIQLCTLPGSKRHVASVSANCYCLCRRLGSVVSASRWRAPVGRNLMNKRSARKWQERESNDRVLSNSRTSSATSSPPPAWNDFHPHMRIIYDVILFYIYFRCDNDMWCFVVGGDGGRGMAAGSRGK